MTRYRIRASERMLWKVPAGVPPLAWQKKKGPRRSELQLLTSKVKEGRAAEGSCQQLGGPGKTVSKMEPSPRDDIVKVNGLKQRKTNSPFLKNSIPPSEEEYTPVLQAKAVVSASSPEMRLCTMLNFVDQAVCVGE